MIYTHIHIYTYISYMTHIYICAEHIHALNMCIHIYPSIIGYMLYVCTQIQNEIYVHVHICMYVQYDIEYFLYSTFIRT